MTISRRAMIAGAAGAAGAGLLPLARSGGAEMAAGADATEPLRSAIDAATRAGRPYLISAGTLNVASLRLADGAQLIGVPGATRLVLRGAGPLIAADGAARVSLSGVTFDGAGRTLDSDHGLVDFSNVGALSMSDCAIEHAGGVGLRLRGCGGRIERNDITDVAAGGVFTSDATGLVIADNRVERCGDNGVQVWRAVGGDDGTRVSGNRISDIGAASGGSGQYGNAISIFRAGGVVVAGNTIRRCAYTAVRDNGGAGVLIVDNSCADLGETAIFAEFGFEGCIIANNSIDRAHSGVEMVNFADAGGRTAVCSGNIIRNLASSGSRSGDDFGYPIGVKAEADATISGNVIEGAPWVGILVGWGASLRDVTVAGNVVRDAPIGIGVSIASGAGAAVIADNVISGASRGAVLGMVFDKPATTDLARGGVAPPQLRISGNQAT